MAIELQISQGVTIIVDECDVDIARLTGWYLRKSGRVARNEIRNGSRRTVSLARSILGHDGDRRVFHLNGDKLDFQRANLSVGHSIRRDPFLDGDGVWKIPLPCGRFALIDECDVGVAEGHLWFSFRDRHGGGTPHVGRFASGARGSRQLWLHREILTAPEGVVVDHINRDGLDNRRANLRLANASQNAANRVSVASASGYRGVRRQSGASTYRATIRGKSIGSFETAKLAAAAYDKAAIEVFGEFAVLNFPHLNSSPCAEPASSTSGNMTHATQAVAFQRQPQMNRNA